MIAAGASIQAACDANPTNTIFKLSSGTYSGQTFTPKNGSQFYGEGNAILNGNGTVQRAIEGQFCDNIRLNGIQITGYNPPNNGNTVLGTDGNSDNWIIEFCRFSNIGTSCAITLGTNMIVRDCYFTSCWLTSIGSWNITGGLIEYNEMYQINSSGLSPFSATGSSSGIKLANCDNVTIRRNWVHHTINAGGIWLDVDCTNNIIEENLVEDCDGPGIQVELDWGAIVRNNVVRRNNLPRLGGNFNGGGGYIQNAKACKVYGNAFVGNGGGVYGYQDARGAGEQGTYVTSQMDVWGNDVSFAEGHMGLTGTAYQDATNSFHDNRYWVTSSGVFVNPSSISFASWQGAGKDAGSVNNVGPAPPTTDTPTPTPTPPTPTPTPTPTGENFLDGTGSTPFSYWDLAEASGDRLDGKAAGNALTPTGTVTRIAWSGLASIPYAAQFDGTSYLARSLANLSAGWPNRDQTPDASFTVGCFVRPSTTGNCGFLACTQTWALRIDGSKFTATTWDDAGNGTNIQANANLSAATIYHVAIRGSIATGEFALFVNGVKQTATSTRPSYNASWDGMIVGYHSWWGGQAGIQVAQPFIFAEALTDSQIASLAASGLAG